MIMFLKLVEGGGGLSSVKGPELYVFGDNLTDYVHFPASFLPTYG